MNRTRLAALSLLFVLGVAAACTSKANNGEECLKNADCESERCVQYVCVDPRSSHAQLPDTGAPVEAGADAVPDTRPDTPADTGSDAGADTATPSDAGAD
jgi:hypothetical protein